MVAIRCAVGIAVTIWQSGRAGIRKTGSSTMRSNRSSQDAMSQLPLRAPPEYEGLPFGPPPEEYHFAVLFVELNSGCMKPSSILNWDLPPLRGEK